MSHFPFRQRLLSSVGALSAALTLLASVPQTARAQTTTTRSGSGYTAYLYATSANDVQRTTAGGLMLQGGGTDSDAAFRWMINKSGGGNFVVLRSTGTDAYNSYIYGLGTVASVETIVITSRTGANSSYVNQQVRNAEAVFIAGGNQADYWNFFPGTAL